MNPEERLEALSSDARWNPITLYPEHGRMPAPERPWRVLAGTAAVLAVVGLVFAGISAFRGGGNQAGPAPYAGVATASSAPPVETQSQAVARARGWLAGVVMPSGAVRSEIPPAGVPGPPIDPATWCFAAASSAFTYWTVPHISVEQLTAFLLDHPSAGMTFATTATPTRQDASDVLASALVIQQQSPTASEGITFAIAPAGSSAVVRVAATVAIGGSGCSTVPNRTPSTQLEKAAADAAAKAAAAARANAWLASATLPPGAARVAAAPDGVQDDAAIAVPCAAMTVKTAHWTVPGMVVSEAFDWLKAHPSPGLVVSGTESSRDAGGAVVSAGVSDQVTTSDGEALAFAVYPMTGGVSIRVDAMTLPTGAACG